MGVHGLWRLIEPSGKPVPLETLENKILAVDISIWLHQAIKGFQDSRGAPLPNAHLLGIYHRVCKLLYFRVKPVFVFDGGVPALKKQTIARRNQQKTKNLNQANDIQTKLLKTLLKQTAVSKVIAEKTQKIKTTTENVTEKEDMYKLPELPESSQLDSTLDSSFSDDYEDSSSSSPNKQWDLHTIDEKSTHFKSLPADVRHEILTELKETRKQSSWGRLHELPTESNEFSSFQMNRLLKRWSVQVSLEEAEKEMGGHTLSLGELEALLNEEGIVTDDKSGKRIASNENARYMLIKDVQKAMEKAKKDEKLKQIEAESVQTEDQIGTAVADSKETDIQDAETLETNEQVAELVKNESLTKSTKTETLITQSSKTAITESEETDVQVANQLLAESVKTITKIAELSNTAVTVTTKSDTLVVETNKQVAESVKTENLADIEYQRDLEAAIQLSLQDQPSTSNKKENSYSCYMENFKDADFDSESSEEETTSSRLKSAQSYMMEYSGLTPNEIAKIINGNVLKTKNKKQKNSKIEEIVADIYENEKQSVANNNKDKLEDILNVENKINQSLDTNKKEDTIELISDSDDSFIDIPVKENPNNKIEKVQEISIDSSDTDTDFVEVTTKTDDINIKPLEILIKPIDNLKDDLFSDIFAEETENKHIPKDKLVKNIPKPIESKKEEETEIIENNNERTEDKSVEKEVETNKENKKEDIILREKPQLTVEELNLMKSNLVAEEQQLTSERNAKERMAGNITDQMYQEAQELLELFGLPYIIAPMEAEAQCAFLNEINLTDGTITDDSDIWLFGGRTVYKNFFNHNKHVLEFRSESIEHHFKLSREQLILLALLVGSDYTLGLQGIGPVTALEILAAFPASKHASLTVLTQNELISGLSEFRRWLSDGRTLGIGRTALRSKLRNVTLTEGFPSLQVIQAYLQPKVETCGDRFTWGRPDIVGLIDFAKEKFGWTKLKTEEILKPVMKKLDDKNIQRTIKDYFATKHKISGELDENKLSKRVKTAVKRMGNANNEEDKEESLKGKKEKKKRAPRRGRKDINAGNSNNDNLPKRKPPAIKEKVNETIPQRERDKIDALKTKLKAIEVFRKSKQGPGFMKRREKIIKTLKEDAELSESSSD